MKHIISRAQPEYADSLTEIAVSAKRHWNYPETWIQFWIPSLTISPEYISSHEVWMMLDENKPIAFYALSDAVIASRWLSSRAVAYRNQEAKQSSTKTSGLLRRAGFDTDFVLLNQRPTRNDIKYCELDHLWVLPEYIGQGIGKQLLDRKSVV